MGSEESEGPEGSKGQARSPRGPSGVRAGSVGPEGPRCPIAISFATNNDVRHDLSYTALPESNADVLSNLHGVVSEPRNRLSASTFIYLGYSGSLCGHKASTKNVPSSLVSRA